MKMIAQISFVMLVAIACTSEGFILHGSGHKSASLSVSTKPAFDFKAVISQLVGVKLNLISNIKSQVNKKFDRKSEHLSKFGMSGTGGFSLSSILNLGTLLGGSPTGNGSNSAVSASSTSSDDFSLDDFGSDLEPGVSVSDGSE